MPGPLLSPSVCVQSGVRTPTSSMQCLFCDLEACKVVENEENPLQEKGGVFASQCQDIVLAEKMAPKMFV